MNAPCKLHIRMPDGEVRVLGWDPENRFLEGFDGLGDDLADVLENDRRRMAEEAKTHDLRLKLGEACNFRCSYCIQGDHPPLVRLSPRVLEMLAARVALQCERDPHLNHFTFWGGEPLLHYPAVQTLTAAILRLRPGAEFSLTTNGLLLDEAKAEFFLENRFTVSISHDGPGQALRGSDTLAEGTASRRAAEMLLAAAPERFSVNPIFARGNPGQKAVAEWFEARFGPRLMLGEATPCWPVDAASLAQSMPEAELPGYAARFLADLNQNPDLLNRYPVYRRAVSGFLLGLGRPLPPGGLCHAYREPPCVGLWDGTVMACHNTGPDHVFVTGMVNTRGRLGEDLAPLDLPDSRTRGGGRCRTCPALPLCRGGCPMVDDEMWEKQCPQRYWHNLPLLAAGLSLVTGGGLLTGVERGGAAA